MLCLISMHHSMILLRCLQYCFLLIDKTEKKKSVIDGYHLCCFFYLLLLKLSCVSVVFVFNSSLNDVAFVSSIPLSVDSIQHKTVKNAFFSMRSCVCDTRHNKSSALNGTRFIKRQILTFESLKICPVSQYLNEFQNSFLKHKQTLQKDALLPFPFVYELHQTQSFLISFVCSLRNQ